MLKYIATLLFSSSLLLANPCTLDLTPNTADILCEDESLNLSITYDQGTHAKGKLTKITDTSGSTSFAYDAKGNIASKTQTINATAFTTTYTYNDQDKLESQTYPSGKVITYGYNTQGELESISIDGTPFITDIQTNQNGLTSYTYADESTHTRVYDTNGRVTQLIYPDYTETVHYSKVSNITSITADETTKQYNYDLVDRLIQYDHNATDYQRFTYDANGNRLTQNQEINKSQSYCYTENTNTLEQIIHTLRVDENTTQTEKEIHYTYDKTGNIINDGTHTYTYDGRNRLTKVDDNITYQYNYDNKRVSKTVSNQTTYYIYEAHKLIGEYQEDGTAIKEYVYYNDTPIAVITDTDTHKIYVDHLDTPRRVADSANTIVWSWESKPFGEDKPTGSYTLNLRFPGQYFDAETKTHYNINRDYNPVTGRYIQSDPIGLDGGVNTFLYANGNGLRFVDESGLLTVYVWNYGGTKGPYGHAAMTLEDGTHISWWPKGAASISNGMKDIEAHEPPRNINEDIEWEDDEQYDYSQKIDFLNEGAIKQWWLKFKTKKIYNGMWRNCSTAVAEGLMAGGSSKYYLYVDKINMVWAPDEIKVYVEAIIKSKKAADSVSSFF